MPNRPKSTAVPAPPAPPWREDHCFRKTFAFRFTKPEHSVMFEVLTEIFYDYSLECSEDWPGPRGAAWTWLEIAAAEEDTRHLAGVLGVLGDTRAEEGLTAQERYLARLAHRIRKQLDHLAGELRGGLATLGDLAPADWSPLTLPPGGEVPS